EFQAVTGVSTGALSAPFVFLGPKWDDELKKIYGGFPRERIFATRFLLDILPRASAADSSPLAALIAEYVDDAFLEEVAREHRRGRRLIVQTTHLDAQQGVVWDMGAIAASGAPNALQLFRDVLLASASVPGAFPPVLIEAELDGETYDEMHVDGGVVSQATVVAEWQADIGRYIAQGPTIFMVRNGRVSPEPREVSYDLLSIAGRAASTLIKNEGLGDLVTAYESAQLRNADVYMTWIGEDFQANYPGPFDPGYMRSLYDYGYALMESGAAWSTKPPQLMTAAERRRTVARAP
ncbi:MAG: patatin family protein, partial [Myxococcales bacterium]|nr:patatin family protein [Myxococcales bacterium]